MPRSRNTRIRPKNTSRAEARRRNRDEQREIEADEDTGAQDANAEATQAEPTSRRPGFAMPNVVEDFKALPQVFRKPLVWLPFGLLALTFVLGFAYVKGALDELPTAALDIIVLYVNLTLHPTTLFIFFIGGFVAPRASYMVGGMLGVLSGALFTTMLSIPSTPAEYANLAQLTGTIEGSVPDVSLEMAVQTIGLGLVIGIFAGGFASWYRRFLRSSQERAKANRMQKEQEQARKAKEQARTDKAAAREARRKGS